MAGATESGEKVYQVGVQFASQTVLSPRGVSAKACVMRS